MALKEHPFFYSFPFNAEIDLIKSTSNQFIPIKIIPNMPSYDRVNDRILLKAYDEECIKGFLFDGIIDYDHLSYLGKTALEKAQAWVGDPTDFYIDKEKKIPVVIGNLFKGNPYVDTVLEPALKAGSKRVAASLGGRVLQKSTNIDPKKGKLTDISKISIKHVALTPLQKAIHQESSVELKKSCSGDGSCNGHCKNCDCSYELQFDSLGSFLESFEKDNNILKALEAGSSTNIANLSGGQVLQRQSLEGVNYEKIVRKLPSLVWDIVNGLARGDISSYITYLKEEGFSNAEAIEIIKLFGKNKSKLIS